MVATYEEDFSLDDFALNASMSAFYKAPPVVETKRRQENKTSRRAIHSSKELDTPMGINFSFWTTTKEMTQRWVRLKDWNV